MKKILNFFVALAFVISIIPIENAHAAFLPISAPSAVLIDNSTNKIIYAKTPHLRRAPASTTKILTSIVAVENLDINSIVTIPGFVGSIEPSKVNLKPGERYRVRELVLATLINSANDAAETLAYTGGHGSRARFVEMMNEKAASLGCKNSHWVNASGLPASGQYSTAYDMALIMREAQRYPFLLQAFRTKTLIIKSASGRKIFLKNHNRMLWRDRREVLGKTGWTRTARHCFVGAISVGGGKVFVSMLGSHKLWRDLKTLVDYEFSRMGIKTSSSFWRATHNQQIQIALKKAGFDPGSTSGRIGPATRRSIKKFQRAQGLRPDGQVGKATWAKLQAYL